MSRCQPLNRRRIRPALSKRRLTRPVVNALAQSLQRPRPSHARKRLRNRCKSQIPEVVEPPETFTAALDPISDRRHDSPPLLFLPLPHATIIPHPPQPASFIIIKHDKRQAVDFIRVHPSASVAKWFLVFVVRGLKDRLATDIHGWTRIKHPSSIHRSQPKNIFISNSRNQLQIQPTTSPQRHVKSKKEGEAHQPLHRAQNGKKNRHDT